MNKLWALTKVLIKTNLFAGANNSANKRKSNKFLTGFLIVFLIAFVMGTLGVPIIMTLDSILEIASLENIFISLILPLAGVTTIIFSLFSVVSIFYLSKDSEHLLPLPVAPKDILLSKFIVSLINEYYVLIMFILPCLIGIGVGINAGVMYYLYTTIIFLLLPVIPSVIVTLIILVVTRFTGRVKNKDLFMYISMFLVLAFAIGYNFIIQEFISVDMENFGTTFGDLETTTIPYFKMIFPFYNSASDALMNFNNLNGFFSLVTFIVFNFIAVFIMYLIGDKLYLKTLIDTRGSKKKKGDLDVVAKIKNKKAFSMLLSKEWLVIKRTPIFMLNIVVIVFLMPIIFIMSFIIGYGSGDVGAIVLNSGSIEKYFSSSFVYLIVMIVGVFFTSFSLAASTAISREGANAWFMKIIPVSPFKQINVKVFFASILDFLGLLIVGVVPVVLFKVPLYYVLCVFIPIILIVFLLNYFNILLDLKRPRIKWSEESVAVKQNLNAVISIFLTVGISGVFGILAYLFYRFNIEMNVVILSGIISGVCVIILSFVIYWFKKNNDKLLDNVD